MSFFDKLTFRTFISNGFVRQFEIKSDYPAYYQDWSICSCPLPYKKFRRFLTYSEPYTKHYMFDILCKEIDLNNKFDVDFIENLQQNDKNNDKKYKSIEFIFDTYHPNWKNFYIIKKDYCNNFKMSIFDTTKIYKNDEDDEDYFYNFIYNDNAQNEFYRITEPDYDLIKEFHSYQKPLYMLILPEDIKYFSYVYPKNKDPSQEFIYAKTDKYLYYIYSQR